MMAEMDNRKKRSTRADKQLVAGIDGGGDPSLQESTSTLYGGYSSIDIDGMQHDKGRDTYVQNINPIGSNVAPQIEESLDNHLTSKVAEAFKVSDKTKLNQTVAENKQSEELKQQTQNKQDEKVVIENDKK